MNIFITGATGYIGNNLALKLADSGENVHVLCRSKSKTAGLIHENIKIFEGNLLDKKSIERAMTSCEYVYHLAAYGQVWAKNPKTYSDINIQGTINILECAMKLGVKRIVHTSTAGTLGPSVNGQVDENFVRTIDFFVEHEKTKFIAEKKVQEYALNGLDTVIVSPTRTYGPGLSTKSNAVSKLIQLYINGKWHIIPGDGNKIGNYVYIDDVVNGHILAMKKGKSGEKYILGGIDISYNEFFDILSKVSHKKYKLFKIPLSLMMAYAKVQELMAYLFNRHPFITSGWVKRYLHDWKVSSLKSERELDYKITPLEEGIEKTIRWMDRANGSMINKKDKILNFNEQK